MIFKFILICLFIFGTVYSMPSYRKTLVGEINDLDESSNLDMTGWSLQQQYQCGSSVIFGQFGGGNKVSKIYSNLPQHDFIEVTMKFYRLDDINTDIDVVVIRVNSNQEQIERGANSGIGELLQSGSNICGSSTNDEIYLKKIEQFSYQSTSVHLEFTTKFNESISGESWGIRDINIKLYQIANLSEVGQINDLGGTFTSSTGWNINRVYQCDKSILGRFGGQEYLSKTYTSIPEYRFLMADIEIYIIDSPDYNSGDDLTGFLNDSEEIVILGKNYDSNFDGGTVNLCSGSYYDYVVEETMRLFTTPRTDLKLSFQSNYDQEISDESWGIRNISISFYNYTPSCPEPFVLTNDETYCVCPPDSYLNSTGDDCVFCENRLILNNTNDGCICPDQSYINLAGDDCIPCDMPYQLNGTGDGCECAISQGQIDNFDSNTCQCTGNFEYQNSSNTCICPLVIPQYFDANSCECQATFIFNYDQSQCVCPSEQIVKNGTCQNCENGTYFINNSCQDCDNTQCATCYGSSTSCQATCNDGCVTCSPDQKCLSCPEGKFLHTDKTCQPCDNTQCATCQNTSIECILQCNDDCQECNTTGQCIACEDGKYLSSGQCLECDNTQCATCTGQNNNCTLSCKPECSECDTESYCTVCPDGFYLENRLCPQCDHSVCATCQSTATQCVLQCNGDCQECDVTGQCTSCEDGKYLSSGQCLECDNTLCATCQNNATNCTSQCNDDCQECDITGQCTSCEDGKFLSSGQCLECDNTLCATCTTNSQNCIQQCNGDCESCNPQGECISCEEGKYLNGIQCLACDNTLCATCQIDNDQCILSCNSDCKTCLVDGTCDSCEDGLYLSNGQCLDCDSTECGTCQSQSDSCIIPCNDDCNNCDITGFCVNCFDGDYLTNDKQCLNCEYQCSTCVDNSDNCLSCSDEETRDFDNNCLCRIGYFQVDQDIVCQECSFKCESCEGNEENCTECVHDSRTGPPNCDCAPGYYDDQETGDCLKCKYECACVIYDYCSQCLQNDSHLRNPQDCSCKKGYYQDNDGNCQQCDSKCQECDSQPDNCTICAKNEFRVSQTPDCGCKQKYFEDPNTKQCLQCGPGCKTCEDSTTCTECQNSNMTGNKCNIRKSGNFELGIDNDNQLEQQFTCNIRCEKCEDTSENCTKCVTGLNRSFQIPDCECKEGYHDNNNTSIDCIPCSNLCETCISDSLCSTCKNNSELNPYTMECECVYGFKINQFNQCQQCFFYHENCHFECPDNTFKNQKTSQCQDVNYTLTDHTQLLYILFVVIVLFSLGSCTIKAFSYKKSFLADQKKIHNDLIIGNEELKA